jgi:hypothetical protein
MNVKSELYRIAKGVRQWALNQNDSTGDLDCWCAICSTEVFKRLKRQGFNPTFVELLLCDDEAHCFVECNGYTIDVTASQFGPYPPVCVYKKLPRQWSQEWFWDQDGVDTEVWKTNQLKKIREHLKSWPHDQNPFKLYMK